ncbi:MAG: cell division protein FtsZ [Flavobacteriales bacterium]|nr:cell division protein FtsZ [Flavobacteriales bacterium]
MLENSLRFNLPKDNSSMIKVIGVGGGGSNAVNYMYEQGIKGVDFIVCNTDAQALDMSPVPHRIQLGSTLTEGRGAGSIPEVGRNAAIENLEDVMGLISNNTNMVFVTAGMGGGTGTGAAPVIARAAKERGMLTVGIITVPFLFEGKKRNVQAEQGIREMRDAVDTLLIIRNDKLRELYGNLTLKQAFSHADEVLCTAAKGIAEVITLTGTVNVDMNDVKTVMRESGVAIMGSGRASGEGRAQRAVQIALESPLLNDNDIHGANFILLNVTFGTDELLMDEIAEITDHIQNQAGQSAEVIWGYGSDDTLGDDICVTVIATGFAAKTVDEVLPQAPAEQKKMWLETQAAEVTQKVEKPTQPATPTKEEQPSAIEEVPVVDSSEPFLFTIEKAQEVEFDLPVENKFEENLQQHSLFESEEETEEIPDISNLKYNVEAVSADEKPTYYKLEDESPVQQIPSDTLPIREDLKATDRPSRTELMARNKDREMRIREFTHKMKTPNGINDLESEPAFVRRRISLENSNRSAESQVSRFSLTETTDENGQKKTELRDNPFLHDNVD